MKKVFPSDVASVKKAIKNKDKSLKSSSDEWNDTQRIVKAKA